MEVAGAIHTRIKRQCERVMDVRRYANWKLKHYCLRWGTHDWDDKPLLALDITNKRVAEEQ